MPRRKRSRASSAKAFIIQGPNSRLMQLPGVGIALAEQGRREIEAQFVIALELALQLALEVAVAVQAGHLVLVLVGHQRVQLPGDGHGDGVAALGLRVRRAARAATCSR